MKRDEEAFKELYRLYSPDVYRFAYRLCRNADEAKDIMSETFVRVWLAENETRLETVKAYLFTIARNLYLQQLRKKNRTTSLTIKNGGAVDSAHSSTEVQSDLDAAMQEIDRLPETDKMVLLLRAENDLSYEEIAQMTGLTISSVKVKIFRARLKLAFIKSI